MKNYQFLFMYLRSFTIYTIICCSIAFAGNNSQLIFSKEKIYITPNYEQKVSIQIKNACNLYGIEFLLKFDPEIIELLDADPLTSKIDLKSGGIIDPKKSICLNNKIDNSKGEAFYTISLLNPAPPVNKDGVIVDLIIKAKKTGNTDIVIKNAIIGINGGSTIVPEIKPMNLVVSNKINFLNKYENIINFQLLVSISCILILCLLFTYLILKSNKTRQLLFYFSSIYLLHLITYNIVIAADQIVYLQSDTNSLSIGENITIPVMYEVTDNNKDLNGIGIRVHYNSSNFEFINDSETFNKGLLASISEQFENIEQTDNDETTDKVLIISYADISNSGWPGDEVTYPLLLTKLIFRVKDINCAGVNVTFIDGDISYGFQGSGNTFLPCLTHGLVAHWKMDGNLDDSSDNGFHGISQNQLGFDENGPINQAAYFDGEENYISFDQNFIPHQSNTWDDFSVSAWFYLDTDKYCWIITDYIRSGGYSGTKGNFWLSNSGPGTYAPYANKLVFHVWNNSDTNITTIRSSKIIEINKWYFVTAISVNNGANLKIFVNGEEDAMASSFYANFVRNSTSNTRIGENFGPGFIDDVRIYNRALTDIEVQKLYNMGTLLNTMKNSIYINPSEIYVKPNQSFNIDLLVSGKNVYGIQTSIFWDEFKLRLLDSFYTSNEDSFFDVENRTEIPILESPEEWHGTVTQRFPAKPKTGKGSFANLKFIPTTISDTMSLTLTQIFSDEYGNSLATEIVSPVTITVNDHIHGGNGTISGEVHLPGRNNYDNIIVTILSGNNSYTVKTDNNGVFNISNLKNENEFILEINAKKHLSNCRIFNFENEDSITIGKINLLGGDLDNDNDVDFEDLQIMASSYNTQTGDEKYNTNADINEDYWINVQDLSILASNYGKIGEKCLTYTYCKSCLDIVQKGISYGDGNYYIDPDGDGDNPPFEVYCHLMDSKTPKEYLNLIYTDDNSNYSYYGGYVWAHNKLKAYTRFKKIRLIPMTLEIVQDDLTFAELEEMDDLAGKLVKYGDAECCVSTYNDCGKANINLEGTPFRLPEDLEITRDGWGESPGTSEISLDRQELNITGGGYCGGSFVENLRLELIK